MEFFCCVACLAMLAIMTFFLKVLLNPLTLAPTSPIRGKGFGLPGGSGGAHGHVTAVIGCRMIGKLPITRSNRKLSGSRQSLCLEQAGRELCWHQCTQMCGLSVARLGSREAAYLHALGARRLK